MFLQSMHVQFGPQVTPAWKHSQYLRPGLGGGGVRQRGQNERRGHARKDGSTDDGGAAIGIGRSGALICGAPPLTHFLRQADLRHLHPSLCTACPSAPTSLIFKSV